MTANPNLAEVEARLERLEEIAKAAAEHLPGEWRLDVDGDDPAAVSFLDRHAGEERWLAFAHCSGGCLEWLSASEFIAAFDPPTVLALLAEYRRRGEALKAAGDALRNHACHAGPDVPCWRSPDQCNDECGREAGNALLLVSQALGGSDEFHA